jgi:hypothetical protein
MENKALREKIAETIFHGQMSFDWKDALPPMKEFYFKLADKVITILPPKMSEEDIERAVDNIWFDSTDIYFAEDCNCQIQTSGAKKIAKALSGKIGKVENKELQEIEAVVQILDSGQELIEQPDPIYITHYQERIKHLNNCQCPICKIDKPISNSGECNHIRQRVVNDKQICVDCGEEIKFNKPSKEIEKLDIFADVVNVDAEIIDLKLKLNEVVEELNQIKRGNK